MNPVSKDPSCYLVQQRRRIHKCYVKNVFKCYHRPLSRFGFSCVEAHPLVNNTVLTLCEIVELAQHNSVLSIISCRAKKGPIGGKDYHVLLFLPWWTDNIWTEDKIICAVSTEFCRKDLPLNFLIFFGKSFLFTIKAPI